MAGRVPFVIFDTYPAYLEQFLIAGFSVCAQLTLLFILYLRVSLIGQSTGFVQRQYSHSLVRLGIKESGCHLPVVEVFQTSAPQAHARHGAHGIRHTAVYLHPDYQFLSIRPARVLYAYQFAAQQSHAHAQQLASADMSVQPTTLFQQLVQQGQILLLLKYHFKGRCADSSLTFTLRRAP
jgi:hypothetical protein